jgi:GTPase-associated system helical domain
VADILQEFLNRGLLDIGEEDSRLDRLRDAAKDLAKTIGENPHLAVYHALVVLSSDVSPADPTFDEVGSAVQSHWETYRNRFPEAPRELFKAVSLQALSLASESSEQIAFGIAYAWRTAQPPSGATREQQIASSLFQKLDAELESRALQSWTFSHNGADPFNGVPKVNKIDRAKLASQIVAAAGPSNAQNEAISGANPHFPPANAAWTSEFGTRMAEAVATTIETALVQVAKEVGTKSSEILQTVEVPLSSSGVLARQISLLWWRKSLYSLSANSSYRALQPAAAVLLMAIDLHHQMDGPAPRSAESLLREGVKEVVSVAKFKLQDIEDAARTVIKDVLTKSGVKLSNRAGLRTLIEAVATIDTSPEISIRNTIVPIADFTPASISCRIFQELQALRLLADAT